MTHSKSVVASNRSTFDTNKGLPAVKPTNPEGGWKSEQERQEARKEIWANALGWIEGGPEYILGGKESRLVCPLISLAKGRCCEVIAHGAEYDHASV